MVSTSVESNGGHFFVPMPLDLMEPGAIARMGMAVWLYLWCVDRSTREEDGVGWIFGGKAINYEQIASDLGQPIRTLRRWMKKLKDGDYITVEHRQHSCMKIGVQKSVKFAIRGRPHVAAQDGHMWPQREFKTATCGPHGNSRRPHVAPDSCNRLENKTMTRVQTCDLSDRLDSDAHGLNGQAKDDNLDAITKYYQAQIRSARLTANARTKIKARLRTYSVNELKTAIAGFAGDTWWMEHNAQRGMAWFFANDDRIEQLIGLKVRKPKPSEEAEALASTNGAAEQPALRTGSSECMCPNCLCDDPPAVDNALCTRCQSGACWKEQTKEPPTPESPQQNVPRTGLWAFVQATKSPQPPTQPHRETNEKPGSKPAYTHLGDFLRKEKNAPGHQEKRKAA